MRSFQENLCLYAQLVVREDLALKNGQELLIFAEIDQQEFVHLLADEAYRIGAKHVEVLWKDSDLAKIRLQSASDEALTYAPRWLHDGVARAHRENAARLAISSSDPENLSGFSPERVAISGKAHSSATKEISALVSDDAINWCLVGASSPAWAKRVFPHLPLNEAVESLWAKIFLASRVLEPDPISAWASHTATLKARVEHLNHLRLSSLHFSGPGTDLNVGLVEGHVWAGGGGVAKNGIRCSPNIPTEEVFTMPHRAGVNGYASSTKPLSLNGQILDEIKVTFKDGEAIKATAATGNEALQELIKTDEGAGRLGEVALVPQSSKVAQAGILFYNSLFDENAASHIAFGASYSQNLARNPEMNDHERLLHGANASLIHVDWMIGSAEVNVDGVLPDGSKTPLMRQGEWVTPPSA